MGDYGEYFGYALILQNNELIEDETVLAPIEEDGVCDKNKVCVKCSECDILMKYNRNRWICPICGKKVTHKTVYDYIQKLNEEFYDTYDDIY